MNLRGELSEKQRIIQDVEMISAVAQSEEEFLRLIQEQGHELYFRNGKAVGIRGKRKYRFTALGYKDYCKIKYLNIRFLDELKSPIR